GPSRRVGAVVEVRPCGSSPWVLPRAVRCPLPGLPGPKGGRLTAAVFAAMMAEETGTSRGKNSCDSLMTICLDVSPGPLDLRRWPTSQALGAESATGGRTLPDRRTRRRMVRAGVGSREEQSGPNNAQVTIRSEMITDPGAASGKSA